MMRFLILLAAGVWLLRGEDVCDARERSRRALEDSLARQIAALETQRQIVSRQPEVAAPSPGPFFMLPWPKSITMPSPVQPTCDPLPRDQVEPLLEMAARREHLPVELLRAVIERESKFRPCAISPKGARGLMQLMPETAAHFGVQDAFDPKQNIACGAKYLKQLLKRFNGNVALALAAYNAGPSRVESKGRVPSIPETIEYVNKILTALPLL